MKLAPNTKVCYKATGDCEQDVLCSGSSSTCPADNNPSTKYKPSGTVCREALGTCGSVSKCSGQAPACPFPYTHGMPGYTYRCNDKIYCHGPGTNSFKKDRSGKWDIGGCKVGSGLETLDELDATVAASTQQVNWTTTAGKGLPPLGKGPPPFGKGGPPFSWGHSSPCTPSYCPNGGNPCDAVFLVCKCDIDNPNGACNWTYYQSIANPPQPGAPMCPGKPFYAALD